MVRDEFGCSHYIHAMSDTHGSVPTAGAHTVRKRAASARAFATQSTDIEPFICGSAARTARAGAASRQPGHTPQAQSCDR